MEPRAQHNLAAVDRTVNRDDPEARMLLNCVKAWGEISRNLPRIVTPKLPPPFPVHPSQHTHKSGIPALAAARVSKGGVLRAKGREKGASRVT